MIGEDNNDWQMEGKGYIRDWEEGKAFKVVEKKIEKNNGKENWKNNGKRKIILFSLYILLY